MVGVPVVFNGVCTQLFAIGLRSMVYQKSGSVDFPCGYFKAFEIVNNISKRDYNDK